MDVIFFLVPNCPLYYVGAKLSWCQIVRCQIVRFYYVGAKLSWCQIVRCQIVLVPNCPGAKLSGAKLSGAKLSYHPTLRIKRVRCGNIAVRTSVRDYVAFPSNHSEAVATWRKHFAFFACNTHTNRNGNALYKRIL